MNITRAAKTIAVDDSPDMTIPTIKKHKKMKEPNDLQGANIYRSNLQQKNPFFLYLSLFYQVPLVMDKATLPMKNPILHYLLYGAHCLDNASPASESRDRHTHHNVVPYIEGIFFSK